MAMLMINIYEVRYDGPETTALRGHTPCFVLRVMRDIARSWASSASAR